MRVNKQQLDLGNLMLRVEKGYLDLEYNRETPWSDRQASSFIESLCVGLPVPDFIIDTTPPRDIWLVIDGWKRLDALQRFLNDDFALIGMEFIPTAELEGRRYSDFKSGTPLFKYTRLIPETKVSIIKVEIPTSIEELASIYRRYGKRLK